MNTPADLIEIYTDNDGAQTAAAEWRTSDRVASVRTCTRTVRAFGASSIVFVVAVTWTAQARARGWAT